MKRRTKNYAWMKLDDILIAEPTIIDEGVSEVALGIKRSAATKKGFLEVYKEFDGDRKKTSEEKATRYQTWGERRHDFITRHVAQIKNRKEPLFVDGIPSRRHLALIAWAYTPAPKKLKKWLRSQERIQDAYENPMYKPSDLLPESAAMQQQANAGVNVVGRSLRIRSKDFNLNATTKKFLTEYGNVQGSQYKTKAGEFKGVGVAHKPAAGDKKTSPSGYTSFYAANSSTDKIGYFSNSFGTANKGWGPLLYAVSVEYATLIKGGACNSRGTTSCLARNTWYNLFIRSQKGTKKADPQSTIAQQLDYNNVLFNNNFSLAGMTTEGCNSSSNTGFKSYLKTISPSSLTKKNLPMYFIAQTYTKPPKYIREAFRLGVISFDPKIKKFFDEVIPFILYDNMLCAITSDEYDSISSPDMQTLWD